MKNPAAHSRVYGGAGTEKRPSVPARAVSLAQSIERHSRRDGWIIRGPAAAVKKKREKPATRPAKVSALTGETENAQEARHGYGEF
jgi:hypothetical protein